MIWANFLHLYQPVTQKPYWVNRVTEECYRPLFRGLLEHPEVKLTVNINSVLVELLERYGHQDVIDSIRTALERGQVELTGSAKYHALLPFLPTYEIERQIRLNDVTHRKYFGESYQPRGFFPPEMAFSREVAETVAGMGFEWIIVDELSFPADELPVNYTSRYQVAGVDNFDIYFRERTTSWAILSGQVGTPELLIKELGERVQRPEYLLTAMDGETFGHHRPGLEYLLFELSSAPELPTCHISELKEHIKLLRSVEPLPSTWALMRKDLERNAPFSRWQDPDNKIHALQWQLTKLGLKLYQEKHQGQAEPVEDRLDGALHSDQYWWASARPWWSIEMIERGAKELYEAVCAVPQVTKAIKQQARELYHELVFEAFEWQRSGKVDELAHQEDEEFIQRSDQEIVQLPREEVEKMIAQMRQEIKTVIKNEQYERAAQIRDRIRTIQEYASDSDEFRTGTQGVKEWDD